MTASERMAGASKRTSLGELPLLTVTGSQRPYIYDLPHLLSLPSGFEFRFRYRHRWVSQEILDAIAKNGQAYAGRQVAIIFHSQDTQRVIPVRMATVLAIEPIGPMIFVRFRAGTFFRADVDVARYSYDRPGSFEGAAATLAARAKQLLGPVNGVVAFDFSNALPSGWYLRDSVCAVDDADLDGENSLTAWAKMVAVLHHEPSLNGIPFFHLMGFRTEEGSVVQPSPVHTGVCHETDGLLDRLEKQFLTA